MQDHEQQHKTQSRHAANDASHEQSNADGGPQADAAVKRMAGGVVPLKPAVEHAILGAADKLGDKDFHGKKIEGTLLGTYVWVEGAVKLAPAVLKQLKAEGEPVKALVCMNTGGGVAPPGETVDANQATHFYLQIGNTFYGNWQFHNPLAKA